MNFDIKDIIFKNFWYKVFSILCGFLLWFMVIGQQNSEITVELPLEYKNVPQNFIITKSIVNKVNVLFSGPSTLIKLIAKKELSFPIDLSHVHKGKNEIVLYPEMLNLPHKINIKIITPSTISIYVDKIVTETKAVVPQIVGTVAKGFKISKISIEPPYVSITAAEDELKSIQTIKTDTINVTDKKENIDVKVPLITNLRYLRSISPLEVEVKIEIKEKFVKKVFKNIKIFIKSKLDLTNYQINLKPKTVTIFTEISDNFKNIVHKDDFKAFIEIDDIHKKEFPLTLEYPEEHIKIDNVSAKFIDVTFKEKQRRKK